MASLTSLSKTLLQKSPPAPTLLSTPITYFVFLMGLAVTGLYVHIYIYSWSSLIECKLLGAGTLSVLVMATSPVPRIGSGIQEVVV